MTPEELEQYKTFLLHLAESNEAAAERDGKNTISGIIYISEANGFRKAAKYLEDKWFLLYKLRCRSCERPIVSGNICDACARDAGNFE